jgi:Tripartite tricarboxylate transporter TctB family
VRARIDLPDLAFALLLVAVGAGALIAGSELPVGRAGNMGPGYVPRGLALIVIAFGIGLGVRAVLGRARPFPGISLRPLIFISGALALFALLLPFAGLVAASLAAVACASVAAADVRPVESAIAAAVLTAFAVLLFVAALGLPIPVWPR